MYQIISSRGTGKTSKLMELAKADNGVFVCSNPFCMKQKAQAYGLEGGFDIISYVDYLDRKFDQHKKVYIDELEAFVKSLGNTLSGYSLTIGD